MAGNARERGAPSLDFGSRLGSWGEAGMSASAVCVDQRGRLPMRLMGRGASRRVVGWELGGERDEEREAPPFGMPPARYAAKLRAAGVLTAASPWRSRLKPSLPPTAEDVEPETRVRKSGYRPWAELLQRTFALDVLTCPSCQGRMRLLAAPRSALLEEPGA
jgi:hypothetical protein